MGRRTSVIGVLVRAHARSVRERKAHERHQVAQARRYEQARAAAARAEAAEQRAAAIAEARDANARVRAEKEAERQRIREEKDAERQAHLSAAEDAEQKTLEVGDAIAELQGLLAFTLQVDDRIEFNSLRIKERPPELSLPMLRLPNYVPDSSIADPIQPPHIEVLIKSRVKPPSFLEKLFRSSRFEREVAAVREEHERLVQRHRIERAAVAERRSAHRTKFDQDCQRLRVEHESAVSRATQQHQQALRAFEAKRTQRDAEVNELEESYRRGDPDSVVLYNEMVLSRSDYPAGFPQQFRLAYQAENRQLVIDYELPIVDIIPRVAEFRYVKARRTIEEKPRKPVEIKAIYREVVAQTALRTLHEVLEADQGSHIDTVVFSGYINKIDETTGLDVRPYLVSVRVAKQVFLSINLARVDPQACLKNLGAQVSANPEEARAVRPIIEFNMVDPRFIQESDVLSQLDARPNLMDLTPGEFEALVGNLFSKMGLETKLTRSSRDGGVDAVAFDTRPVLGGKVVIQAKRYRHTVGVSAVRDLYGTMLNEGASKGIVVTTSGYGPDAYNFANDKPLELIDGGGLLYLLDSIGRPARIIMPRDPEKS